MSSQPLIEVALYDLDSETAQLVAEVFDRYGWGGAVTEQRIDDRGLMTTNVKTYVQAQNIERLRHIEISLELLNRVRAAHQEPPVVAPTLRTLSETDWAEAWKANYHVFNVGQRLVVKPSWEPYDPKPHERVIEIDPGMAFGSGLHATTRLCLTLLEEHLCPGDAVLDLGSGSGILAIAAARLGATSVLALDIDPEAVCVAQENVQRNGLAFTIVVQHGTLAPDGTLQIGSLPDSQPLLPALSSSTSALLPSVSSGISGWNVILANLLAETIIVLAPALARNLLPAGALIASGIIPEQSDEVARALRAQGMEIIDQRAEEGWVAICARRPNEMSAGPNS